MTDLNLNRRNLLAAGTAAGLAGAFGLPALSSEARADAAGKEYVFLSIVTHLWIPRCQAIFER
ncbi:twin-arginine translocation signal domain-containing protein [Hoeflea sp.]|uniref:twin-arginine translocation signal domain-containing protein n=1 Tax=Hoeflea sp. TaxID=1940281 RepID=UPI003B028B3F